MRSADPAAGGSVPRALDRGLFAAALAVSAFVLLWPTPPGEPLFPYADKLAHVVVFLAVAWTGSRAGLPVRALGAGLLAYAVASEVIQETLLPDRSGDWTDVIADLAGTGLGLLVARSRRSIERAR